MFSARPLNSNACAKEIGLLEQSMISLKNNALIAMAAPLSGRVSPTGTPAAA
jgi:hypothetical protein